MFRIFANLCRLPLGHAKGADRAAQGGNDCRYESVYDQSGLVESIFWLGKIRVLEQSTFETLPPALHGETRFRLRLRGGRRFTPPERFTFFKAILT